MEAVRAGRGRGRGRTPCRCSTCSTRSISLGDDELARLTARYPEAVFIAATRAAEREVAVVDAIAARLAMDAERVRFALDARKDARPARAGGTVSPREGAEPRGRRQPDRRGSGRAAPAAAAIPAREGAGMMAACGSRGARARGRRRSAGACVSAPPAGPATAPRVPGIRDARHSARRLTARRGACAQRHEAAWQRLQAGDLRGAARDYTEILRSSPAFYPAEAGLGFVALAGRDFKAAVARFRSALSARRPLRAGVARTGGRRARRRA